jgi:hypothetical protein
MELPQRPRPSPLEPIPWGYVLSFMLKINVRGFENGIDNFFNV